MSVVDELPPGENAADELTGPRSIEVMSSLLNAMTAKPTGRMTFVGIEREGRWGRWFIATVNLKDEKSGEVRPVTVRLSRERAQAVCDAIGKALGR